MDNRLDALVLDLVEWVAETPRPYQVVMDVWRTSCPRLTVWEDAVDRGYLERRKTDGRGIEVAVTPAGCAFLERHDRGGLRQRVAAPVPAWHPTFRVTVVPAVSG